MNSSKDSYTAFVGMKFLTQGALVQVVSAAKEIIDTDQPERVAIYNDLSGHVIDIDYRGSLEEVLARLADHPMNTNEKNVAAKHSGPGRPKLGVVSREVTLLPRHWEWLADQTGGASAAIRRLVDKARKENQGADKLRKVEEATHRFLWDMASELPYFEESSRCLYRREYHRLEEFISEWPEDIKEYLSLFVNRLNSLKE